MRKISVLEYRARQLLLRTVVPASLEAADRASRFARTRFRRSVAVQRHVKGSGIEVGAAATPAIVPLGAKVKYVDKYDINVLRADDELVGLPVRAPDIIATAEKLEGIETDSQDFVLAFSLLEHVQNVLGSIAAFHRVTKDGGSLVLSVPDKRHYRPDRPRPITPFEHFARDFRDGPEWSVPDHFREVGATWKNLSGPALDDYVAGKIARDGHCHFHVWDAESFLTMLLQGKHVIGVDYEIVQFEAYGHEALAVLKVRKSSAASNQGTLPT